LKSIKERGRDDIIRTTKNRTNNRGRFTQRGCVCKGGFMNKREEGYYWVESDEEGLLPNEKTFVAYYNKSSNDWTVCGDELWYADRHIDDWKIGPRIPTPDEVDYTQLTKLAKWLKASSNRSGMSWQPLAQTQREDFTIKFSKNSMPYAAACEHYQKLHEIL